MLLLAAVDDGATHGYGLIQHLSDRTHGAITLAEGTVYTALHRLWRAGYLARAYEKVAGRRRLAYRLTAQGRQLLATRVDAWDQDQADIAAVLGDRVPAERSTPGRR